MEQQEKERIERKKNRETRAWQIRAVQVFCLVFIVFFVLGLLIPLRPKHSETEKRELQHFPRPTSEGIMNGSFFRDMTTWYSDSYPFRDAFVTAGKSMERLYGLAGEEIHGNTAQVADEIPDEPEISLGPAPVITVTPAPALEAAEIEPEEESEGGGTIREAGEVAGTVYITNNRGFEVFYFSQENADRYASAINTVRSMVDSDVNFYFMIPPTQFGVCLSEEIRDGLGASDEHSAIKYVYDRIDPSVVTVDVYNDLVAHNDEYIYFHTDHHWTADGAYYAYRKFCEKAGLTPQERESFETMEFPGFLGTLYAASEQSEALAANPDTVKAYLPKGVNTMDVHNADGNDITWPVVNDVSDYESGMKYYAFLGGDQPLSVIHNPEVTDGSSLLVVKDSYANIFVPFLVDHYENLYIMDFRYDFINYAEYIEDKGIENVLILTYTEGIDVDHAQYLIDRFYY